MGMKILWHLLVTSFPRELIERGVIIKWFCRRYCIVPYKIQCTNGELKYILMNKMGTTLTEEYGTTTSTTSTTAELFEVGLVTGSRVWGTKIKLYYFWLGSYVILIESNLSDQYFVDWLHSHTLVTGYHATHIESRDVQVNSFGLFWNLLFIKSLIANGTPPMSL